MICKLWNLFIIMIIALFKLYYMLMYENYDLWHMNHFCVVIYSIVYSNDI